MNKLTHAMQNAKLSQDENHKNVFFLTIGNTKYIFQNGHYDGFSKIQNGEEHEDSNFIPGLVTEL